MSNQNTAVEAALVIADFKKGVRKPSDTKEAIAVIKRINNEFALESLRILAAEVRRLRELTQWQDMKTAPKSPPSPEGKTPMILLTDYEGNMAVGYCICFRSRFGYSEEDWFDCRGKHLPIFEPVKWMPLPPPPAAPGKEDET
jgi:hypothetical protein